MTLTLTLNSKRGPYYSRNPEIFSIQMSSGAKSNLPVFNLLSLKTTFWCKLYVNRKIKRSSFTHLQKCYITKLLQAPEKQKQFWKNVLTYKLIMNSIFSFLNLWTFDWTQLLSLFNWFLAVSERSSKHAYSLNFENSNIHINFPHLFL